MKSNQLLVIAGACVVSIALRMIDTPIANFGSMAALALLCGSVVQHRAIFLLPLAVRLLTDSVIHIKTGYGFFESWPFDYGAYIAICAFGSQVRPQRWLAIFGSGIASVALYFLLSNLGVWMMTDMYPQTVAGLSLCYLKAMPFAKGTILGNLVMVPVFFAAWKMATATNESSEVATAKS